MSICARFALVVLFVIALQGRSQAVVVYTESIDGELSPDNLSPTDLGTFMVGSNTVTGQVTAIGSDGFNFTADIFTFEIAAGQQLDTIFLTEFTTAAGEAVFLALDDGPTFQFSSPEINDDFNLPNLSLIMGGVVVGTPHIGTDILDDLQSAFMIGQGSMFTTPLGPGQYSVYIQETGPQSDYQLSFNVSAAAAVPEPSSACLMALAGLGFGVARRRRNGRKSTSVCTPARR